VQTSASPDSSRWVRVFARCPGGALESERLHALLADVSPRSVIECESGERDWERITLTWPEGGSLVIERFHRDETGIRGELQAWAAWLETLPSNPHTERLMAHMIQTLEVLTLRATDRTDLAIMLAQAIAKQADGVYQVDGVGVFASDGLLLVRECDA
jgi:hypothetical protein